MAGIIRILLAIALEMLVAFDVFKAVLVIIVYSVGFVLQFTFSFISD